MAGNDTIHSAKKAAVLTNPTSAAVFLQSDNSAKAAAVFMPDRWEMGTVAGSVRFTLRAWGRVTPGTTGNFTPRIMAGSSITDASNTAFATGGAASYSASGCWFIDADCVWDSTSKTVNGFYQGNNASAGTIITEAAITQLTSKDYTTNGLGFTVDALFGTSNSGNLAYLDGFTLEAR